MLWTKNILQATCQRMRNTELCLEVKNITKRERRNIETLIYIFFLKQRAFYRLNE